MRVKGMERFTPIAGIQHPPGTLLSITFFKKKIKENKEKTDSLKWTNRLYWLLGRTRRGRQRLWWWETSFAPCASSGVCTVLHVGMGWHTATSSGTAVSMDTEWNKKENGHVGVSSAKNNYQFCLSVYMGMDINRAYYWNTDVAGVWHEIDRASPSPGGRYWVGSGPPQIGFSEKKI